MEKDKVILDVNNVGYLINIPEGDAEKIISMVDSDIKLNIYTDIKENDISLYGFLDSESLSVFEKLIKVSGVGSKMARGILSFMTPQEICIAIANEDSALLTGVPGVGEKTAFKLIQTYGSIEDVLKNVENVNGKKLKENLEEYSEQALFSKKLATIITEVPIDINLDEIRSNENFNKEALKEQLIKLEMKKLLYKIIGEEEKKETSINTETINTLEGLKKALQEIKDEAFYCCHDLDSITLPSSLRSIGKRSFLGCRILNHVTIPLGLHTIGKDAFIPFCSITIDRADK